MSSPDWKAIALYLADCAAATAEQECALSSVSQSRKKRHRKICHKAALMIAGKAPNPRSSTLEATLDRLNRASGEPFVAPSVSMRPEPGTLVEIPFVGNAYEMFETGRFQWAVRVVGLKGVHPDEVRSFKIGGSSELACLPPEGTFYHEDSEVPLKACPILIPPNIAFLSLEEGVSPKNETPVLLAEVYSAKVKWR